MNEYRTLIYSSIMRSVNWMLSCFLFNEIDNSLLVGIEPEISRMIT